MGHWKNARDLTDDEVRDLLASALSEISFLRRAVSLVSALVLAEMDEIETPPPDVREAMIQGVRGYLDMVMDVTADEDSVIRVHQFEQHMSN